MKEIVNRLHEKKQIELAKSILESNGYKVTKKPKRLHESSLSWSRGGSDGSQSATYRDIKLVIYPIDMSDADSEELSYYGFSSRPTKPYAIDFYSLDHDQIWIDDVSGTPYATEEEAKRAAEKFIQSNYDHVASKTRLGEATTGSTMSSSLKRSLQIVADELDRRSDISCVVGGDGASITYRREGSSESFNMRVSVVKVPEYHVYNHLGDEVIVAKDLKELELSMTMLAKEDLL